MESQEEQAFHLPPCNPDADSPEDVYPFDDRILLCSKCLQDNRVPSPRYRGRIGAPPFVLD